MHPPAASRRGTPGSRRSPGGEKVAEPPQAFADPLDRRGVGEPQIALGVAAKSRARRDGHVRALEDLVGEADGVAAEAPRVGEDIERALRLETDAEADRAQAVHHHAPALGEDATEARGLV